MKVHIKGKGDYELTDQEFVAQGGEASVYAKNGLAFKIYHDPSKMIPLAKIQELGRLTLPNIIKPEGIVLDSRSNTIGYTMRHLKDAHPLCQIFTKTFRDQYGLTSDNILSLVKHMRDTVTHIHHNRVLVVDLNECNFLADKNLKEVEFIDVDSYQTPSFKATALMESIRDRHTKGFSELTDWFAFAIVSFQMFIGIHPYKGKHATVKTIDERMQKNISVFNKDVSIPKVCYPFDLIPQAYRDWYKAMFDYGKRVAPPSDLNAVIHLVTTVQRLTGGKHIDVTEFAKFVKEVYGYWWLEGTQVAQTPDGLYASDLKKCHSGPMPRNLKVGVTAKTGQAIAANIEGGKLKIFNVSTNQTVKVDLNADAVMSCEGRLYFKNKDKFFEIEFFDVNNQIVIGAKPVANVLENAVQIFDGVLMQNLLGRQYAYLFPKSGECRQVVIKEISGFRVVSSKYDNNVLMVIGNKNGKYDKFIFRFDSLYSSYDVRVASDIALADLNFVTLDNGICVHINDDEEIEVFSNKKDSSGLKVVDDPMIGGDMRLFKQGVTVVCAKGDTLYTMKLK